ncbi:MAG: NAD(P)H-binding protein [Bacteroidales bacterium]
MTQEKHTEMEQRKALVFGSTGLVGNLLLEELILSSKYSVIKVFVRQPTGLLEPKVVEIVSDLTDIQAVANEITGDDIFICLGTTIKKAGSVSNMEKIDRDLPVKIAETASFNGVKNLAVVSSIGASPSSANYYLRIKGEMEQRILSLGFSSISVVRPSMLLGERRERRTGEMIGKFVMTAVKPVLTGKFRKYRAIHGRDVARSMIALVQGSPENGIYESHQLQRLSDSYNQ